MSNEIEKHPMLYWLVLRLTMSPSGGYVTGSFHGGLAANPAPERSQEVTVVFETSSGDVLYEYSQEGYPKAAFDDFNLSDKGELLLRSHYGSSSSGNIMREHTLLGPSGQILWWRTVPIDQSVSARRWLARDGSGFVEVNENLTIKKYSR